MACITGLSQRIKDKFKRRSRAGSRATGSQSPGEPSHKIPSDSRTLNQQEASAEETDNSDPSPPLEEPDTSRINADHSANQEAPAAAPRDTSIARSQKQLSLWEQALKGLSAGEQTALDSLVPEANRLDTSGTDGGSVPDIIHDAIAAMKSQQKIYKQSSRTDLREVTTKIVRHLTQAGDFAINFTPSIAQQIWPIGKWLLQIPLVAEEQMGELLKIADIVCHVFAVGCVYETYYTKINTPRDGLDVLHHTLIKVYQCALQSLAIAVKLMGKGEMARIGHSLWDPDAVKEKVEQFPNLLNELSHAAQTAQAAKSSDSEVRVSSYLEKWGFSIAEVDSKLLQVVKRMDSKDGKELLDWVSTVKVGDDIKSFVDSRAPETCAWILTHRTYQKWESSSQTSGLVWLQGAVGTGKSHLTAKVLQRRQDVLEGPKDQTLKHEGLAFFFFNRDMEDRRTALSCLKSLIRQLSIPYDPALNFLPSLEELRDRCSRENRSLGVEDCKTQLQYFIDNYPKITLIIDAIDECGPGDKHTGRKILLRLLGDLVNNNTTGGFRVFVSGRPEADILTSLKDQDTITVNENQDDIMRFIKHKIKCDSEWTDEGLKAEVTETVVRKCKSVFRLAQLQIAHLIKFPVARDVRCELEKLPRDLKDIYDMIYNEQIAKQGRAASRIAKRAIMWVLVSERRLTSDDLLLAIRIDPVTSIVGSAKGAAGQSASTILDPMNRLDDVAGVEDEVSEAVLLQLCANFLTIQKRSVRTGGSMFSERRSINLWQFCHASVSEYFEENHFTVLEATAHVGAAAIIACMHYGRLGQAKTDGEECQRPCVLDERPAFQGCSDLWEIYAERIDRSVIVEPDAIRYCNEIAREEHSNVRVDATQLRSVLQCFLGHPNKLSEECHLWYARKFCCSDKYVPTNAYYLMIRFNFDNLLKSWWDTLPSQALNRADVGTHAVNGCPIINKMARGKVDCYPDGVDINPMNLLQWACFFGRVEIVKKLIVEAGMDPNSGDPPPLTIASDKGRLDVCKWLLENRTCDPDSPRNLYNPLYRAARAGHVRIIRLLLKHGASPDPPGWKAQGGDLGYCGGSPIAAAASCDDTTAMQVLIEEGGADPNVSFPNAREGSAAITAARELNFDALEYLAQLSDRRIDPNAIITTGELGSVLSAVIFRFNSSSGLNKFIHMSPSSSEVFERLAALKINFNATIRYPTEGVERPCGSVLEYYTVEPHLDRVKELIEKHGAKADFCSEYGDYGCALIASFRARCRPDQLVARYLVETAGANVNLQVPHGKYHSPLAGAAVLGENDDMEYLIQNGAQVNLVLEYGEHRSALMVAAAAGKETAVQFLIQKGADISRPENQGWKLELERRREVKVERPNSWNSPPAPRPSPLLSRLRARVIE